MYSISNVWTVLYFSLGTWIISFFLYFLCHVAVVSRIFFIVFFFVSFLYTTVRDMHIREGYWVEHWDFYWQHGGGSRKPFVPPPARLDAVYD
jgi:hypothetical protein